MQTNWDDLRIILAIARAGSLAGAARSLGVNHSTVFRRLNSCESQLGVRVFERRPEGYRPTVEGEEILRHCDVVDSAVLALERTVAGKDYRLTGVVRLTTAPNLASTFVASYLPAFRQLYPDIRVELATGDREFDLARREADLALRATARPPEYLHGRRVCGVPWWVFGPRDSSMLGAPPQTMQDLAGRPLVGPEASFLRLSIFSWMQAQYAESQFVACASDLNSMKSLVAAGLGYGFLPIDQQGEDLQPLFPVQPAFAADLWLLSHPDLRHVQRLRVFADFLVEALRADWRLRPPLV